MKRSLLLLLVAASVLVGVPRVAARTPSDVEKLFLSVPSNDTARDHLYKITKMDHVAGTAEGLHVAGYVQDELAKALDAPGAGVTVVMDAVKVLQRLTRTRTHTDTQRHTHTHTHMHTRTHTHLTHSPEVIKVG